MAIASFFEATNGLSCHPADELNGVYRPWIPLRRLLCQPHTSRAVAEPSEERVLGAVSGPPFRSEAPCVLMELSNVVCETAATSDHKTCLLLRCVRVVDSLALNR